MINNVGLNNIYGYNYSYNNQMESQINNEMIMFNNIIETLSELSDDKLNLLINSIKEYRELKSKSNELYNKIYNIIKNNNDSYDEVHNIIENKKDK